SQRDLSERAGVSRQLVGAVEAGRHVPNVRAALALARALEVPVERLFGDDPGAGAPAPVPVLDGPPLPAGSPVVVAAVGGTTVVAPCGHGVADGEAWAVPDGAVTGEGVVVLDRLAPGGLALAGCDPAIGMLAGLVERRSTHRVVTVHASTARSVAALAAGRVHGVVVHGPEGGLADPPVPVRRWRLGGWLVGLASGRAGGVPPLDEVAARRLAVVQRDDGAGSQQALQRALAGLGAPDPLPGPVAGGHIDVARRVAAGAAAGVTMEAAARSYRLAFRPLEAHAVELWLDARWVDLPAAVALVEVLGSAAFRRRLELIGGYDLVGCGSERGDC
ncbi:MAG TPA: substrate-binding domain-containing protein, partial [Acidimicrobiales bacterium]